LNKWDAIEDKDNETLGQFVQMVRDKLPFLDWAPILTLSALTGQRAHKVLDLVETLHEKGAQRIATAELNRVLAGIVAKHKPPSYQNKHVKLYYISQVSVRPPTLVLQANLPKGVPESYRRYLLNKLREAYDFEGTPVKLIVRRPRGRRRW